MSNHSRKPDAGGYYIDYLGRRAWFIDANGERLPLPVVGVVDESGAVMLDASPASESDPAPPHHLRLID